MPRVTVNNTVKRIILFAVSLELTLPVLGKSLQGKIHPRDSGQPGGLCAGKEMKTVTGPVGGSITLPSGVTKLQEHDWVTLSQPTKSDEDETLLSFPKPVLNGPPERFGERLRMNSTTGSITIGPLNSFDAGLYRLQIINGQSVTQCFNLTVEEHHTEPPGADQQSPGHLGWPYILVVGLLGAVVGVGVGVGVAVVRAKSHGNGGHGCACFQR